MLKRSVFIILFLTALVLNAYAQNTNTSAGYPGTIKTEDIYAKDKGTPLTKIGRGTMNIATCFYEIPTGAMRLTADKGPVVGYSVGVVAGFFTGIVRAATGIVDIATCLFPPYNEPLMKPEFALEGFQEAYEKCSAARKDEISFDE